MFNNTNNSTAAAATTATAATPKIVNNNLSTTTTTTTTKTNIMGQGSVGNEIYISSSASSSSVSSSSDDESHLLDQQSNKNKAQIRVGVEYQADLTNYDPNLYYKNRGGIVEKETAVWMPCPTSLDDQKLDAYIEEAMIKWSYSKEQALIMLFYCGYSVKQALAKMANFVPRPSEWTPEEKILFEQAFWLYSKNFNKIRQVLPDKSQASLVTYYYVWKKSRQQTTAMDSSNAKNTLTMDHSNLPPLSQQQQSTSGSGGGTGNGTNSGGGNRVVDVNGNGNNEDFDGMNINSDDSDVGEAAFDSNGNQICCNCDFISNDLESTPKGYLCQQCYVYWKETGGMMRPEYLIDASLPTSSSLVGGSSSSNGHGMKSTNNRYMTLNNNSGNSNSNTSGSVTGSNNLVVSNTNSLDSVNSMSKEARNFHKSLRKPPKGIFMELDELIELASSDTDKSFDLLDKKIFYLKMQTTGNQRELERLVGSVFGIEKSGNESIDLRSMCVEIKQEEETSQVEETTLGWTTDEVMIALLGFNKYGDDVDAIAEILKTKSPSSIRSFYNYYRDDLSLDKLIYTNTKALGKKAASLVGEVNKKMESTTTTTKATTSSGEKTTTTTTTSIMGCKEQPILVSSSRSEQDTNTRLTSHQMENNEAPPPPPMIQQSLITTTTSINSIGILDEDLDIK